MIEDPCRRWREQLGAYALGLLASDEETVVRAHVDGCPSCAGELAEISSLRGALDSIDVARVATMDGPPAGLGERIADTIQAQRSARRTKTLARVVGVAAIVIALAGVASTLRPAGPAVPTEQVAVEVNEPGVTVDDATLIAHTWGTELVLKASGLEDTGAYQLVFRRADGTTVSGGTFIGVGGRPLTCRMNAAVLRADTVAFVIRDSAGTAVMTAKLPPAAPAET